MNEVVGQPEPGEHFAVLGKAVPVEGFPPSFEEGVFEQASVAGLGREAKRAEATVACNERGHPLRGK